ncbi:hypothetical protein BASA50_004728 [Batrachochytrium salamandrivorans]|uniref:Uncharacterized protein n=1 Tax=Batrachochytrium salamandrivorans TaxID=1357716 RepID=A0ABQ8FEK1_9FUNG|nr:hypothetical protein BASA62_009467 [Batrachochytrium salamandrivorans]KAH6563493.1 hypothetical protein BASA60_010703 [Batrachochytrium salamandrivorans]KAH6596970.1 hypothetical protein BASA50_004728 [Batrachochytrium salamandrivorans]KAH9273487.1 hypothetical protein BASA83_004153 [Batrachochytrium salamandrivorans]KAJ1345407.1 hypothetical protein BSLG_000920 [Batrachochytrium salamandrivorans]
MEPSELIAYFMAHPDLLFTDTISLFWQMLDVFVAFARKQAPKLTLQLLDATPTQVLVLLGSCLAVYLSLFVIAILMRGVMRCIVLAVKTAVFCCVLVLAMYVAQAYLLSTSGLHESTKLQGIARLAGYLRRTS